MKIFNKRAKFDYEILAKYEAGIELNGLEAKAVRHNDVDLTHSFAKIVGHEVYLINASIASHNEGSTDSKRTRKLLLHKNEILEIEAKMQKKRLTLIPIALYTKGRLVKAEIALAHKRREFEKKEKIKNRDIERDIALTSKLR
jgi:SsrA-binding protein